MCLDKDIVILSICSLFVTSLLPITLFGNRFVQIRCQSEVDIFLFTKKGFN